MKRSTLLFMTLLLYFSATEVHATPIIVDFSFDSIASGFFSYDSGLDGGVLSYEDLDSFELNFSGLTNSSYDLAFVLSGNSTTFHFFEFDSSIDAFVSQTINGFPTILADIKKGFGEGFFVRDDLQVIRNYAGGGEQFSYQTLSLSVDRTAVVPEPSTIVFLGMGMLGMVGYGYCRKKAVKE